MNRAFVLFVSFVFAFFAAFVPLSSAQRGGGAQRPPASARQIAPYDFTGYWVSVVTEDWRWRMMTPAKGDYASVPLNRAAERVADAWDPAKDEAAGEECRAYGAPAIMRVPGRIHITWQDDSTLRVDADAGTQTRDFRFGAVNADAAASPSWQGRSIASWEPAGGGRRGAAPVPGGSLKVVTTGLRFGYLRKNGVPYSANTILTEFFTGTHEDNGDAWLIVTTVVQDPDYLTGRFFTSSHFKKLPNASGWTPTRCSAR